jgi:prolyl-tRNA synthetase
MQGGTVMPNEEKFVEAIVDKSVDFSGWYVDVVIKAQLADYGPVKGFMIIRPYGYGIWERMQALLDARFKATGHQNAYFPLLIPESFLAREAEHVAGFAPQVAWVTQGGDEKLEERLAIRPTSEAIIGPMYAKWIDSWRDLPVLINQWCSVLRWEKLTRPFLRTTEFLWQEGHTVHRTEEEAEAESLRMLEVYRDFIETELAIPVITGRKSEQERFAGALRTYTVEALMADGRALQAGTSHNLGQHFAKVFGITFQDEDGQRKFAYQTSWGVSTRLIGAVVMVHGDDAGLILPPNIAPIQVIIVPIWRKEAERAAVQAAIAQVEAALKGRVRVQSDWSEHTPGWKFNEWELKGVPVRLEVGPRDVAAGQAVVVRRDTRRKEFVPLAALPARLEALLAEIQQNLFARALAFREANTHSVDSFEEFKAVMEGQRGFIRAHWCGQTNCELAIKEQTGATLRCIPLHQTQEEGQCILCGEKSSERVLFARAY